MCIVHVPLIFLVFDFLTADELYHILQSWALCMYMGYILYFRFIDLFIIFHCILSQYYINCLLIVFLIVYEALVLKSAIWIKVLLLLVLTVFGHETKKWTIKNSDDGETINPVENLECFDRTLTLSFDLLVAQVSGLPKSLEPWISVPNFMENPQIVVEIFHSGV